MMELLDRSKAVIELGKRIVAGLEQNNDVAAQWMSHMVAEKILTAEQAPETARDAATAECVEMIMKLWAHRYTLPPYMRPLRELDPLLRTLNSLGVDEADEHRFFMRTPNAEELDGATDEERQLFEFAIGIDHAARELIRHALSAAAERSVGMVKPWLDVAVKGNLDAAVELRIANFAVDGLLGRQGAVDQLALLNRINKLESFANVALSLAGEMRKTLPPVSEMPCD